MTKPAYQTSLLAAAIDCGIEKDSDFALFAKGFRAKEKELKTELMNKKISDVLAKHVIVPSKDSPTIFAECRYCHSKWSYEDAEYAYRHVAEKVQEVLS